MQQLARRDHGAFAAQVLLDPDPYVAHRIELASDAPTPTQMAAALTSTLTQQVQHQQIPLDQIRNPARHALWTYLHAPEHHVDLDGLHTAHPEISWSTFNTWATGAFEP